MPELDDAESQENGEARSPQQNPSVEKTRLELLALPHNQQPGSFDSNMQEHREWVKREKGKGVAD